MFTKPFSDDDTKESWSRTSTSFDDSIYTEFVRLLYLNLAQKKLVVDPVWPSAGQQFTHLHSRSNAKTMVPKFESKFLHHYSVCAVSDESARVLKAIQSGSCCYCYNVKQVVQCSKIQQLIHEREREKETESLDWRRVWVIILYALDALFCRRLMTVDRFVE